MTANRKVDIFDILRRLNAKDVEYFKTLSEDEQKSVHPLVLMRWLSGSNNPQQVMILNEFVNPYIFSLSNNKDLLMRLLVVGGQRGSRAKWLKRKKQKSSSTPLCLAIVKDMFGYSTREALSSLRLIDNDTILQYAEEHGYQKDEIRKLKSELRTRNATN